MPSPDRAGRGTETPLPARWPTSAKLRAANAASSVTEASRARSSRLGIERTRAVAASGCLKKGNIEDLTLVIAHPQPRNESDRAQNPIATRTSVDFRGRGLAPASHDATRPPLGSPQNCPSELGTRLLLRRRRRPWVRRWIGQTLRSRLGVLGLRGW